MTSTYYAAGIPYSSENSLYHFGIKGQKWGIRRYQNPDGTLTPAGKVRYGDNFGGENSHSLMRRLAVGDHALGLQRHRDKREDRLLNKIEKRKDQGKDTKKLEEKYNAQKQKNIDLANYTSNTSTGKLWAQNLFLTGWGADRYRSARARGEDRVRSFVESFAFVDIFTGLPVATGLRVLGDQDKYGRFTHSEL